jgi:hypothetical protein
VVELSPHHPEVKGSSATRRFITLIPRWKVVNEVRLEVEGFESCNVVEGAV